MKCGENELLSFLANILRELLSFLVEHAFLGKKLAFTGILVFFF